MKTDEPETAAPYYYRPVPGSRELITGGLDHSPELKALELARPGPDRLLPLLSVAGEWLGGARVEAGFAAIPVSVWDRLALLQTPIEQAVYQHLVRLAYGEGRNYCWVGKRELERRCRLSERRLHVALDGLVQKGHLKPLARRNLGTLYRVFLPAEALDGVGEPGVRLGEKRAEGARAEAARAGARIPAKPTKLTKREESTYSAASIPKPAAPGPAIPKRPPGRRQKPVPAGPSPSPQIRAGKPGAAPEKATAAKPAAARPEKLREKPLESPLNEERFADVNQAGPPRVSVGEIAAGFFKASGVKPTPEERDAALSEITALLEDGFAREEVLRAAEWYGRRFKNSRKLDRLAYYIHQALAGEE